MYLFLYASITSQTAYTMLKANANGFTHGRCFAAVLREWEEAGYPLDGETVQFFNRKMM